jgi:hypothetical protein
LFYNSQVAELVDANGGKCDSQSSGTPIKKFGSHIQVRVLS